jgi:4-oxalocrotonate tautomerase
MPIVTVQMWEGRSKDQKRELVQVLTRETARIIECPEEVVQVILEDVKKEHWGLGGKLASDL